MQLTKKQLFNLRKLKRFRHWLDQYALVEQFRDKYDRFPRSNEEFPKGNRLGRWYNERNRIAYRKGRLKLWQVHLLNEFNYVYELANHWDSNFTALKKGWTEHPDSWPYVYYYTPHLKRLEKWCKDQRRYYSRNRLSGAKIAKLDSINFPWIPPSDAAWTNHYENLQQWTISHNRFPRRYSDILQERIFAAWIAKERSKMNLGRLNTWKTEKIKEYCRKLKYDPKKQSWEESHDSYKSWYSEHGRRPGKYARDNTERRFGSWIVAQNVLLNKGLLTKEHAIKLAKLKNMVNFKAKKLKAA